MIDTPTLYVAFCAICQRTMNLIWLGSDDDGKAHYRRVATDVDRATPSLLAPASSETGKLGYPQSFTVEISGYYNQALNCTFLQPWLEGKGQETFMNDQRPPR